MDVKIKYSFVEPIVTINMIADCDAQKIDAY